MKKDLPKGRISREAFQQWLNTGTAPLTVESGSGSLVTVLKLSKTPEIDYLYGISAKRAEGVSWGNSLQFCGAYDRKSHMLCLPDRPLVNIVEGLTAEEQENGGLAQEISDRVNRRVEETIANDRNNLSMKEIINRRTLLDLEYYREYGAKEEAIQYLFGDQKPDGQFHSDYHLAGLAEAEFIAWLQDPEAFVKAEDITAVTYCRRTIYEAPFDQKEAQDLSLKMGGM